MNVPLRDGLVEGALAWDQENWVLIPTLSGQPLPCSVSSEYEGLDSTGGDPCQRLWELKSHERTSPTGLHTDWTKCY